MSSIHKVQRFTTTICFIVVAICCISWKCEDKNDFTLLIYMNGSNLESRYKLATGNINDIVQTITSRNESLERGNLNIVLLMGGTREWHLDESLSSQPIPNDSIVYARITCDGFQKICSMPNRSIGEEATLREFIQYGTANFPANRYGLIFWNHGAGSVTGFGYDEMYPDNPCLSLAEIRSGLDANAPRFSFIGFDACLMATLETAVSVSPYADYLVASQELEPGKGWDYKSITGALMHNPDIATEELCRLIVDSFIENYKDNQQEQTTLSVTDLSKVLTLTENIGKLSKKYCQPSADGNRTLYPDSYNKISGSRVASKSFGVPALTYYGPDMVDLLDFCRHLSKSDTLTTIRKNLQEAIVYSRKSENLKSDPVCGLSLYFPCYNKRVAKELTGYGGLGSDNGYLPFVRAFAKEFVDGSNKENIENAFENDSTMLLSTDMIMILRKIYANVQVLKDNQWISYGLDGAGVTLNDEGRIIKKDKNKKIVKDWDKKWICIGNKPVTAYMMPSTKKDSLSYTVPVKLNSTHCDLILKYDRQNESGRLCGARQTDNALIPGKGMIEIQANDTIIFRYERSEDNDSINYIQSKDTIIVQQNLSNMAVRVATVPKGKYRYGYCLVDLYGRRYYTKYTDYNAD